VRRTVRAATVVLRARRPSSPLVPLVVPARRSQSCVRLLRPTGVQPAHNPTLTPTPQHWLPGRQSRALHSTLSAPRRPSSRQPIGPARAHRPCSSPPGAPHGHLSPGGPTKWRKVAQTPPAVWSRWRVPARCTRARARRKSPRSGPVASSGLWLIVRGPCKAAEWTRLDAARVAIEPVGGGTSAPQLQGRPLVCAPGNWGKSELARGRSCAQASGQLSLLLAPESPPSLRG